MPIPSDTVAAEVLPGERSRVLLEVGRTIAGTLESDELFRTIYREASRVLEAEGFYLSLYDESRDRATAVFYADRGDARLTNRTYRASDSAVYRTGDVVVVRQERDVESLVILGDADSGVTRSAVSAPMRHGDRIVGVVSVQSFRKDAYSREDVELLRGVADFAAVAIENSRRVAGLERRRREAERVVEIGRRMMRLLDPDAVAQAALDAVLELLEVGSAVIWTLQEGGTAHPTAWKGPSEAGEPRRWQIDARVLDRLVREPEHVIDSDPGQSTLIPPGVRERCDTGTLLAVPLVVDDRPRGGVTVQSAEPDAFGEEDIRLLSRLAAQASVALKNAERHEEVRQLSLTDPRTGLANRRHLEVHLEREVAAARRGRSLSLVLFDLIDLESLNDRQRHRERDRVLEAFVRILREQTRTMNLAARYGGEEFAVVASDTGPEAARILAERVAGRATVDPWIAPHGIGVRYGVAGFDRTMEKAADLIRRAERDLYHSKKGRPEQT